MKKLFRSVLVLTVIFLFVSCAMFQTKREILNNNIFSCINPELMLKIDNGFEYKGTFEKGQTVKSSGYETGRSIVNYYIWHNEKDNKILIISFNKILHGWHWVAGKELNKKYVLQIKRTNITGKKWKTGFWTPSLKNWQYNKFIDMGIEPDGNWFSKIWTRTFGEQMNVKIIYAENINNTGINRNTYKMIANDVLDHEIRFIEIFEKRANVAIMFIK